MYCKIIKECAVLFAFEWISTATNANSRNFSNHKKK